jgi:uncharacterized protein YecT (DUF1311 family)
MSPRGLSPGQGCSNGNEARSFVEQGSGSFDEQGHMIRFSRTFVTASLLMSATMGSTARVQADEAYDACIKASDGSNQAWLQCGNAFVDREKRKLEAAWNTLIESQEGRTRDDLLSEHRAWLQFSDLACEFYNNGDLGREGQVLSYPACKAQVYADRSRVLKTYGEGP